MSSEPTSYDFARPSYENHRESLFVPWVDPSLLPKTQTVHDQISERLTIEALRTTVGDTQENS